MILAFCHSNRNPTLEERILLQRIFHIQDCHLLQQLLLGCIYVQLKPDLRHTVREQEGIKRHALIHSQLVSFPITIVRNLRNTVSQRRTMRIIWIYPLRSFLRLWITLKRGSPVQHISQALIYEPMNKATLNPPHMLLFRIPYILFPLSSRLIIKLINKHITSLEQRLHFLLYKANLPLPVLNSQILRCRICHCLLYNKLL